MSSRKNKSLAIKDLEKALSEKSEKKVEEYRLGPFSEFVITAERGDIGEIVNYFYDTIKEEDFYGDEDMENRVLTLYYGDRTATVLFEPMASLLERIVSGIAKVLKPDYGIRMFAASAGSSAVDFLICPKEWWEKWDGRCPDFMKEIFLPV